MEAARALAADVGVTSACDALSIPRASFYRRQRPQQPVAPPASPRTSPRALSAHERQQVLSQLDSERFADMAPAQVYAAMLSEGQYLCSPRTMYRILSDNQQVRERRDQRQHPRYTKPELLATEPNQLWSWDITKLKGAHKWTYYYLYVLLDVFSRYVVGWMVASRESAALGQKLITQSIDKHGVEPSRLTVHADRGSPMTAKSTALLLADLGVTKTHSRPHVSNDNPFSESQFKTMKYRPDFPDRFGSLEDARGHCAAFMRWYNDEHYHSGLALFTPADVQFGRVAQRAAARQAALDTAHAAHPERFVRGAPTVPMPPAAVWINPPAPALTATDDAP